MTILLRQADLAREVLAWAQSRIGEVPELALARAWGRFADGRLDGAPTGSAASREALLPVTPVETHLLETAIALRSGQPAKARRALHGALGLAEPMALVRPFLHADPPVRELLAHQLGSFGPLDEFAGRVLSLVSGLAPGKTHPALTERERTVLARLPSPRSLDEIANDLNLSRNTVKTHVRTIYAKLGAKTRRSAVVAARERGLL
jgi:LuxR family maltose regulon positive regulatory protein